MSEFQIMGVRHVVVVMNVLALTISYMTRVDLSSAIVEMTDVNKTNASSTKTYNWSESTKSNLLVALFVGYFWLQLPAGYLSDLYGARNIISGTILITGLMKFLTPISVTLFDWFGLAVCRFIEGLVQGALLPASTSIMVRWLPPSERVYFGQLIFGGIPFGTTIGLFTSGYLLSTSYGWPFLYYVEGVVCLIFTVIYHFSITSTPKDHPFISEDEKQRIIESTSKTASKNKSNLKVPWLSLLTSFPVIALIVTHTARNYGYWTFFTQTPRYISGVTNLNIKSTGFYSSLPNLCACVTVFLFTLINLGLQKHEILSLRTRRKIWVTIALGGQGIACLILAIWKPTDIFAIIAILSVASSTNVAIFSGTLANQMDLSPNFGGILMAFTTLVGSVSGVLAPFVVSFIVKDKSSTTEWGYVFLIGGVSSIFGNVLYVLFGSAEVQIWNDPNYKASGASSPK